MARLDYVELPASDLAATKRFYEDAFGWSMTEFAPTYAATMTGDTDVGLQADATEKPTAPLPVVQVKDLESALESVERAGVSSSRSVPSQAGGASTSRIRAVTNSQSGRSRPSRPTRQSLGRSSSAPG